MSVTFTVPYQGGTSVVQAASSLHRDKVSGWRIGQWVRENDNCFKGNRIKQILKNLQDFHQGSVYTGKETEIKI